MTNLELVRAIYEAWEAGDFGSADWASADIELVGVDGPAAGTFRGKAALRENFRDFLSAWESWSVRADGYRELDDERVLVPFHFSARGKLSGLEVGQIWTEGASVFHVRDGQVTRLLQYLDRARAWEDLGLA